MKQILAQISWFDLVVAALLMVGLARGRKRGMSGELLDVLQWLIIIVVGAMAYKPIGDFMSVSTHFSPMVCYIAVYVTLAIVIKAVFTLLKRSVGEKLVGADVFGSLEYYLGMIAGMVRFSCMLVALMAVLHAKEVTAQEVEAQKKYQLDNYGSVYFPTFDLLQYEVFQHSITGQAVNKYLHDQLIMASSGQAQPRGEGLIRRREQEINSVINGK
jgi:uncharacterized membrane protein required for colicin V production